jgi:hypothetical protein
LNDLLPKNPERLRATTDYGQAIADGDVPFIIVPLRRRMERSPYDKFGRRPSP